MKGSKRNERKDAERESVVLKAAAVTPAGLILLLLALAVRGCGIGRKPAGQSSEAETVCESSSSTFAVNLSDIPSFRTTYPDISGTIYSFLSPSENSAESQSAPSSAVSAASAASSVPESLVLQALHQQWKRKPLRRQPQRKLLRRRPRHRLLRRRPQGPNRRRPPRQPPRHPRPRSLPPPSTSTASAPGP